ncbi:MAG: hypothetical protein M0R73_13695 [Dehalococcoidia bacterium]|nr:hypothetical protein [Dehalococcoidia bacterium]
MYERVVSLADVPTLLSTSSEAHAAAMAQMFGALPTSDEAPRARIDFGPGAIALPAGPPDESLGDVQCWHEPGGVAVEHMSGLTARVSEGTATVRGDCPDLSLVLRWICQPVLAYLLAPFDRFLLHAGAAGREGSALVLLGQSGSGKSTATYAALCAGWEVLGDDHVVLRRTGKGIEVTGIPKPLSVPGEVAGDLPAGARRMHDERDRWELPSALIAVGWRQLASAVAVRHADSPEGAIHPTDRLRLLREMIAAFPASGSHEPLTRFLPLAATVSRDAHSELRLGRDPARRVQDAGRLLGRILPQRTSPVAPVR